MQGLSDQLEDQSDQADLTPMIDCVFLLLLFFIVTSSFTEESLFKIELPKASKAEVYDVAEAVVLSISKSGQFAIGKNYVPDDQLWQKLSQHHKEEPIKTLIIKGDRRCPYEKVVMALDVAQALEIADYGLVIDRKSSGPVLD
jgi:biopolymer transport protein ExbD